MQDRITVNMGAADLVVEVHNDPGARRKGIHAVYILDQQGKRVFPYVCPMKLPTALEFIEAAKGQLFSDAKAANDWLEELWLADELRVSRAA